MIILNSVDSLLEHIKEVQENVIGLSHESLLKMSTYIESHKLEINDEITTALQYQDIITQQLNATIEAIDSMKISINKFNDAYKYDETLASDSMSMLAEKLNTTLIEAKDKKSRFTGNTSEDEANNEIEFF